MQDTAFYFAVSGFLFSFGFVWEEERRNAAKKWQQPASCE
jgi:hypothetical protein